MKTAYAVIFALGVGVLLLASVVFALNNETPIGQTEQTNQPSIEKASCGVESCAASDCTLCAQEAGGKCGCGCGK